MGGSRRHAGRIMPPSCARGLDKYDPTPKKDFRGFVGVFDILAKYPSDKAILPCDNVTMSHDKVISSDDTIAVSDDEVTMSDDAIAVSGDRAAL